MSFLLLCFVLIFVSLVFVAGYVCILKIKDNKFWEDSKND